MAAIVGIDAEVFIWDNDATAPVVGDLPVWTAGTPGSWSAQVADNKWLRLPERNEISVSISVDVAEHKPFVTSLGYAWVDKARTWMNWSGSFSGFYDDTDTGATPYDTTKASIFGTMKAGISKWMVMYDSRLAATVAGASQTAYWFGKILLTSVDHTTGSEDFATLDVDFEGLGPLYRGSVDTSFTYG